jgi:hypothetical protein
MCPNLDFGCPSLENFWDNFSGRINEAVDIGSLPEETQAVMVIEDWAKDLKKVTLRIVWPGEGDATKSYERVVYLHAHRGE